MVRVSNYGCRELLENASDLVRERIKIALSYRSSTSITYEAVEFFSFFIRTSNWFRCVGKMPKRVVKFHMNERLPLVSGVRSERSSTRINTYIFTQDYSESGYFKHSINLRCLEKVYNNIIE